MTEDQAMKKMCCVSDEITSTGMCAASKCMAWRWVQKIANETEIDRYQNNGLSMVRPKPIYENTKDGYCGRAGRP